MALLTKLKFDLNNSGSGFNIYLTFQFRSHKLIIEEFMADTKTELNLISGCK